MAKVNFKRVFKAVERTAKEHSPELLTGIGIAGFIATVILAVKATPEVADSIEYAKENIAYDEYVDAWNESHQDRKYDNMSPACFEEFVNVDYDSGLYPVKLKFKDIFLLSWRAYLPAAITGVCSTACVIGGISTSLRRTAAMATAAQIAETTLKEYSKKVVEEIGEEKEQKIKEEARKSAVEKVEAENKQTFRSYETRLYCDGYLNKPFYATPVELEHIFGELNRIRRESSYISLNDFYSMFHAESCPAGEDFGWSDSDDDVAYYISDSTITYDGRPALIVKFSQNPHEDYSNNHRSY